MEQYEDSSENWDAKHPACWLLSDFTVSRTCISSAWEVRVGQPRPIPIVRSRDALCPFKGWPTIDRGLFAARKSANKKQLSGGQPRFRMEVLIVVTLPKTVSRDHLREFHDNLVSGICQQVCTMVFDVFGGRLGYEPA